MLRADNWERVIEKDIEDLQVENREQQKEINALQAWRNWVLGAAAIIIFFLGIFAKPIIVGLVRAL